MTEVRNWPIDIRTFYIQRLSKILEERNRQIEQANRRK